MNSMKHISPELNQAYEELQENLKDQRERMAYKERNPYWLIDALTRK